MEESVAAIVVLSLQQHDNFPVRTFTVHPDTPCPVGRFSISHHAPRDKPLKPSPANAIFDNPVVSRDHAEITMGGYSNAVKITDHSSMHGTYVNSQRLRANQPYELHDGDQVSLGTAPTGSAAQSLRYRLCQFGIKIQQQQQSHRVRATSVSSTTNQTTSGAQATDLPADVVDLSSPASTVVDNVDLASPRPEDNFSNLGKTSKFRSYTVPEDSDWESGEQSDAVSANIFQPGKEASQVSISSLEADPSPKEMWTLQLDEAGDSIQMTKDAQTNEGIYEASTHHRFDGTQSMPQDVPGGSTYMHTFTDIDLSAHENQQIKKCSKIAGRLDARGIEFMDEDDDEDFHDDYDSSDSDDSNEDQSCSIDEKVDNEDRATQDGSPAAPHSEEIAFDHAESIKTPFAVKESAAIDASHQAPISNLSLLVPTPYPSLTSYYAKDSPSQWPRVHHCQTSGSGVSMPESFTNQAHADQLTEILEHATYNMQHQVSEKEELAPATAPIVVATCNKIAISDKPASTEPIKRHKSIKDLLNPPLPGDGLPPDDKPATIRPTDLSADHTPRDCHQRIFKPVAGTESNKVEDTQTVISQQTKVDSTPAGVTYRVDQVAMTPHQSLPKVKADHGPAKAAKRALAQGQRIYEAEDANAGRERALRVPRCSQSAGVVARPYKPWNNGNMSNLSTFNGRVTARRVAERRKRKFNAVAKTAGVFALGAIVGSVGVISALVSLPDSFF